MAYEAKNNSGSMFLNQKKEKDSHPDRTGSALIDGVEYWISGWVKKDKNGNPWMSLAFKRKEIKPDSVRREVEDDLNDDIPFN